MTRTGAIRYRKGPKVQKRCLKCRGNYEGRSALSFISMSKKREWGICDSCKHTNRLLNGYSEEDLGLAEWPKSSVPVND